MRAHHDHESTASDSVCASATQEPFAAYVTPPPHVGESQSIIWITPQLGGNQPRG